MFGLSALGPHWGEGGVRTTSDSRSSRGRGLNPASPFLACTAFPPCGRGSTAQQQGAGNQLGQAGRAARTDWEELFVFIIRRSLGRADGR